MEDYLPVWLAYGKGHKTSLDQNSAMAANWDQSALSEL